ncbi:MAG: Rpn family recombination-promoting nuclease/putative transposase, partial [Deltaproteobacteria bacterium]|nr:Rpn family recombination-promoting nuclease/putative transposase [Deltaproteobacteria bacterium]
PKNTRAFLKSALPASLRRTLDLAYLHIDPTNYVSKKFKERFSDIVVKTRVKKGKNKKTGPPVEIYILFEHKSYHKPGFLVQLLYYMYLMWEQDLSEDKPLRVIIPLIFYHGGESWTTPPRFVEQFDVPDEVKEFMLDYRYVFFDTLDWDFETADASLKQNIFTLTALALMKSASNDDLESILQIFKFWHEKGFVKDKDNMLFFMEYISETKDIDQERLENILEETKIEGGDLMPTLAQRLRDEGRQEGIQTG